MIDFFKRLLGFPTKQETPAVVSAPIVSAPYKVPEPEATTPIPNVPLVVEAPAKAPARTAKPKAPAKAPARTAKPKAPAKTPAQPKIKVVK